MAYYDLAHGGRSFDAYLAISPTFSILDSGFDAGAIKLVSSRGDDQPFAYFAMSNESGDQAYFHRLRELAKSSDSVKLKFEDFSESDDHHSVRAPALLSGLRWLFADYRLLPYQLFQKSDQELDAFYESATKKFKTPMELSVMDLTNAAYWGLESANMRQRALSLFELAVATWPTDAYAWSCMAEGFERTGQIPKAKEAIEKAVDFGRASGFADMAYLQAIKKRIDSLDGTP
jgi:tetratricopeptide (TPR) repeat protein